MLVASGKIDGIFIGLNWITHPDLVKRVVHGKPLNNITDFAHIHPGSDDWSVGYTDYPSAAY